MNTTFDKMYKKLILENKDPNTGGINKKKYKKYCKQYTEAEIKQARENLSIASNNLLLVNPFFGYLLLKQKVVESSKWLPTAAVDGKNFYFNTGFVLELSIHEIQFLICHELLHLIYGHLLRLNYPNGLPRIPSLFNIANDYIVNNDVKMTFVSRNKSFQIPSNCYIDEKYLSYSSEEVYEQLYDEMVQELEQRRKEFEKKKQEQQNSEDMKSSSDESCSESGGEGEGDGQQSDGNGLEGEGGEDSNSNKLNGGTPSDTASGSGGFGSGEEQDSESNEQNDNDDDEFDMDIEDIINDMFPDGTFDEHLDLSGNSLESDDAVKEDADGNYSSDRKPIFSDKDIEDNMNALKGDLIVARDQIPLDKRAGMIPEGALRVINELTEPVFNWRQYIKKYILGLKKTTYSWTTPKRRSFDSDIILPGKKREKMYKIHVSMDTSGSISDDEIRDFLSEVFGATRQLGNVEVTIWTFDTKVYNPQTYTKRNLRKMKDYEVLGNGGTAFLSNWEHMKENKIVPDIFIMFTDGLYCDAPGIKGYCPTLYVLHGDYADRVDIDKSYGRTITYKKDAKTKRTRSYT